MCFCRAVVDLRAQGVQRDTTLVVALDTGHFRAAEAAGRHNLDALDLGVAHRGLDGLTHGATERDTVDQLLGDGLRNQGCVGIDVLDLDDVQRDHLAGELLQLTADAVGLGATAADDDARARGVDVHTNAVAGALDDDVGDAGALKVLLEPLADPDVLGDVIGVVLVGVPVGLPVGSDTQAQAVRVNLLAHYLAPSLDSTTTVMWEVRFRIWNARPWARGW